ncbi:hypothetical protein PLICRDRAFT_176302 [Plicaturopsis crispa FD-325 SS-3]|nr:hypothetical protein PLICRDRAFT_176302 [Plicaturopsis crispa FD-325 SS-3]
MAHIEERPATTESATPTIADRKVDEKDGPSASKTDIEAGAQEVVPVAHPTGQQPHQFPDGGAEAWAVVAGAWMVSFCTFGYVNGFGVYQEYYQTHQLAAYTPSDISWIGSVQLAMIFWGGLPMGKLFDMGYMRPIMLVGSIWTVFCLMMTSLATTYWEILLAQGFGLGLGLGMLFIPAISCISHFFRAKRSLANGLLASGSSLGGIVFPIMLNNMIANPNIGFEWAVRATGFLVLALLIGANLLLKTRLPPHKVGPIIDFSVFKDVNYSIFVVGSWFILFGLYLPFFYLQEYAIIKGVDQGLAFYTLAILNAASVFGRTIPNYLADKWGTLNILFLACLVSGVLIFVFLVLQSAASFIVFAIFFGFFSGTYVSTIAPCVAALTTDMRTIGLRVSMFFGCQGFAALFGTPINGALVSRQNGSFTGAVCFSGISVFLGCAILAVCRYRHGQVKGTYKV